jgi:peptidoglycan/LPS O-acetylase OafA/YrhL
MVARPAADSFCSSNLYFPSLDGLRAIAFFFVFIAHAQPFKVLPGGFGVTVFFFLSGYLITSLLRDEARKTATISLKGFYLRRVLRIFPPCYLTVIIVTALAAAGIVYNRESYASLVSAFLYFSNYWNTLGWGNLPAGLGILWSLAVEEHYYLLFPLLYAWFVRRSIGRRHQAGTLIGVCFAALAWRCYRSFVMPLGGYLRGDRYTLRLYPGRMRACDCGQSAAGRSGGVVHEACCRPGLGRRGRDCAVRCLPELALPGNGFVTPCSRSG